MIRVTIWYEHIQEMGEAALPLIGEAIPEEFIDGLIDGAKAIKRVHPNGLHNTIKDFLDPCEDMTVTAVTLDMPECGLPDALLDNTDVLIWWAHAAHELVPDALAEKVRQRVLKGMGFIPLHSAHPSKPFTRLIGTSGALRWREDDFCRVWNVNPRHPIAEGIPDYFELPEEEMYGERFDVPTPEDTIFISWFRGGEVFRSGLTWTRGYGRIFYFQPGHETNPSYYNPYVQRVIINAIRWARPTVTIDAIEIPYARFAPEANYR